MPPGFQFGKETIIYGCNTQGKSTLTAILRSLSTGNNDILIGRKTFGVTGPKKIELDFEAGGTRESFVFQNRAWNKHNPSILIFDSRFITKNICDGDTISFEQQQNLNTIIVGENGQTLKKAISDLQKLCDENTVAKTAKNRELNRSFPNTEYALFKSISLDDEITEKIQAKEQEQIGRAHV